jgi:hypothetical protein
VLFGRADRLGELGDGRGSLEDQVEQRAAQRVGVRADLRGRGDVDRVRDFVVRGIDRH